MRGRHAHCALGAKYMRTKFWNLCRGAHVQPLVCPSIVVPIEGCSTVTRALAKSLISSVFRFRFAIRVALRFSPLKSIFPKTQVAGGPVHSRTRHIGPNTAPWFACSACPNLQLFRLFPISIPVESLHRTSHLACGTRHSPHSSRTALIPAPRCQCCIIANDVH